MYERKKGVFGKFLYGWRFDLQLYSGDGESWWEKEGDREKEGWKDGISSPRQEVGNFGMMAGLGNGIREGATESHGWTWGNVLEIWVDFRMSHG